MKTYKKLLMTIALLLLLSAMSCRDSKSGESVGREAGDGENYNNEQNQSSTTETGQNIGTDTDSTSVGRRTRKPVKLLVEQFLIFGIPVPI